MARRKLFQFSMSSAISVTVTANQKCNEETACNLLKYLDSEMKETAELSAFAENSAKEAELSSEVSILRFDCVEGGERGRSQRNSLNQKERFARDWLLQLACKQLSTPLSCVVGLSSLEPTLVNSQGRDF